MTDVLKAMIEKHGGDVVLQHAPNPGYDPVKAHAYYEAHKHLKGRSPSQFTKSDGPTHKHRTTAIAKDAKKGLGPEKRKAINEETSKAKAALTRLTEEFRSWVDAHPNATPSEKEAVRAKSLEAKAVVVKSFRDAVAKISSSSPANTKTKASIQVVRHDAMSTGNTTAAIMALPMMLDPIRLVGDEEKHATLLYFGDTTTLPPDARNVLLDVVAQASHLTNPFREQIVDISRLGPENPPALVAKLSSRFLGSLCSTMQISPQVREYLRNTSQFPEFTPHVTLGYPDYAEEASIRELMKSLYKVQFDRLSLWWNDERFDISLSDSSQPISDDSEAAWSDEVSDFLAHHGVKGMRWGIRKEQSGAPRLSKTAEGRSPEARTAAVARVKAGKGTLGDAHLASIKSTGHRVTNGLLGDKTFWKRMAIVAGATGAGVGASIVVPGLMPAAVLTHFGIAGATHSSVIATAGAHSTLTTSASSYATTSAATGAATMKSLGIGLSVIAGHVSTQVLTIQNAGRSILGNKRVNDSYAKIGKDIGKNQHAGDIRVQKVLNRNGSIAKKNLRHEDSETLVHAASTIQDVYNSLSSEESNLFDLVVGASVANEILPDLGFADIYAKLSDTKKNLLNFIVGQAISGNVEIKHSVTQDDVDAFLAHHGIKGMRWGFRRERGSDGTVGSKGSAPAVDKATAKALSKAKVGTVHALVGPDRTTKLIVKNKDGSWSDTHLSADAERLVKTHMKSGHEMSDAEIKAAINRAKITEEYDKLLGSKSNPNAEMKTKVEALQLQRDYAQLHAQLHPSKMAKVASLIKTAAPGFKQLMELDKLTGGIISSELKAGLGAVTAAAAAGSSRPSRPARGTSGPTRASRNPFKRKPQPSRKPGPGVRMGPTPVHNVTNVDRPDPAPGNPFIPALEQRR